MDQLTRGRRTLAGVPPWAQEPTEHKSACGLHLIGDFFDCRCSRALLVGLEELRSLCMSTIERHGLTAVASAFHRFAPPGGITGVVALAESHLSLHTWPEKRYVTLDVYVCNYEKDNRGKARSVFDELAESFRPGRRRTHALDRD